MIRRALSRMADLLCNRRALAVALVAVAVIARWVGPHAYGVFALSWIAVGLVEIVVSAAPTDANSSGIEKPPIGIMRMSGFTRMSSARA